MKMTSLWGAALLLVVLLPISALARDIYPEQKLEDIYVLTTEGNRALLKVKGAEREYVAIGDVVGAERMVVVKIDGHSVMIKSADGDIATRLPVGGGMGF